MKKGSLGVINGICCGFCPIDGNYYGVSGAGGAMLGSASTKEGNIVSEGGIAGKYNQDHLPTGGIRDIDWTHTSYARAGGGGASYDNDGQENAADCIGGAGGDAVTYGCGGGGGGAAPYNSSSIPGAGGTGAYGGVIIAY